MAYTVKLRKVYVGKEAHLHITYDKTSGWRPAWIFVKNAPKNARFLYVRINEGTPNHYLTWYPRLKLFLPVDATPAELKKYYDKFARTYDAYVEDRNTKETAALYRKISRLLPKNAKVLDLGAGTGHSSIIFAENDFKVTLVDFSPQMLAVAKTKKALKHSRFICSDVKKLRLTEKFDLIVSINSFAATPYYTEKEMPGFYKKIARLLKPGGIIALSGFDFNPPTGLFKKIERGVYRAGKMKLRYYVGKR